MHILKTTHGQFFALYRANASGLTHVTTGDLVSCPEALALRAWPLADLKATAPAELPRTMCSLVPVLRDWIARLEQLRPARRTVDDAPTPGTAPTPSAAPARATATRRHRPQPHYLRAGHSLSYWNGHAGGSGLRRFG